MGRASAACEGPARSATSTAVLESIFKEEILMLPTSDKRTKILEAIGIPDSVIERVGEFSMQWPPGRPMTFTLEIVATPEEILEVQRIMRSNAEVSGAGTASAGLPGYTAGDNTE